MKNAKKKIFSVLASLALLGGAAPAVTEAAQVTGMEAFRSSYFAKEKAERDARVRVILYGPSFRADTEFTAVLQSNGSFLAQGEINWTHTELTTGETSRVVFPAFVENGGERISLYGYRGGQWNREDFMGAPLWILEAIGSDDLKLLSENAEAVQSVTMQDSLPGQYSMRVTLDGPKLAERARKYADEQGGSEAAKQYAEYLARALAQTSPTVIWVVDEQTKETITAYVDLTKVMQKYAQSLLEGNYQSELELSEDSKAFLNAVGYYCNLQVYFSQMAKDTPNPVMRPEVRNAPVTNSILTDLQHEAVASSQGK